MNRERIKLSQMIENLAAGGQQTGPTARQHKRGPPAPQRPGGPIEGA